MCQLLACSPPPFGWLVLKPIRDALDQSAPPGWHVFFPALPAHWTWTCFHSGQVLVAALAPDTPQEPQTSVNLHIRFPTGLDGIDAQPPPTDAQGNSTTQESSLRGLPGPSVSNGGTSVDDAGGHSRRAHISLLGTPPDLQAHSASRIDSTKPSRLGERKPPSLVAQAVLCRVCLALLVLALLCTALDNTLLGATVKCALLFSARAPHNIVGVAGLYLALSCNFVGAVQLSNLPETVNVVCDCASAVSGRIVIETSRPIPTPCRRNLPSEGPPLIDSACSRSPKWALMQDCQPHSGGHLTTLLEEAARCSDHWAFLAATLLETLVEHVSERPHSPIIGTPLSLAAHLPETQVHDLTAVTVDFGTFFS